MSIQNHISVYVFINLLKTTNTDVTHDVICYISRAMNVRKKLLADLI